MKSVNMYNMITAPEFPGLSVYFDDLLYISIVSYLISSALSSPNTSTTVSSANAPSPPRTSQMVYVVVLSQQL